MRRWLPDVVLDRRVERARAAVYAAPELLHRQRREEALDQVIHELDVGVKCT